MKIRSLLTGLFVAIALSGCGQSATAPEARPAEAEARFNGTTPTPPDTTAGTNRTGGGMGSGN